ncbi:hypothetical protein XBFM1_750066 [Xenorhabdus bovienii str. feltiae Moldova]|uniref:Uncharacterized protein n=1 Tax=Xenorhabdus bovienii str. feltiae Moldova TaxID=1398200 RepID=A0A077NX74_XENBV|nr:hypothetical protein XBFM1_750066 [Xenorhabdus bovienii str. feltiae Moldova]
MHLYQGMIKMHRNIGRIPLRHLILRSYPIKVILFVILT